MSHRTLKLTRVTAALLLAFGAAAAHAQGATIEITSRDPAGIGFNDPTPVAPVGGNPGTTLGAQRLFVYRYVADIWQAALKSDVKITVSAGWEALTCTSTSAVLGSASAWNIWNNFPNGKPGTWYHQALANKLAGVNLSAGVPDDGTGYGNVDIKTQFNVNLGNPGCLDGQGFYLGVDGNAGTKVNFVATLLHELGHGLGFSVLTRNSDGWRILPDGSAFAASGGLPAVWEEFMFDSTVGKTWLAMTNAERQASAINPLKLAWTGAEAVAGAAATLSGTPSVQVASPVPGTSGLYDYSTAAFGPAVNPTQRYGILALSPTTFGCDAYTPEQAALLAGKVAVVTRGNIPGGPACGFALKTKNAQNAGAVGVVVINNAPGSPVPMGGADATITIPAVMISQAAGVTVTTAIQNAPRYGTRSKPGVVVTSLGIDATRRAGADSLGRPLLNTPATLAPGSSVSHWDPSAFPNLLMEPAISGDLTTVLVPPKDLTVPLLLDIGWTKP